MALYGGVEIPGHPDLANVARLDRLAIPLIRRAHRLGIAVDREYFRDLSAKFAAEITDLERDIASYIPVDRLREFSGVDTEEADEAEDVEYAEDVEGLAVTVATPRRRHRHIRSFNASSPEQIAKLLYDMLGIGGGKNLKKTAAGRASTGKKQLELIKLEHPVVPKVLRHREVTKLKTTYADKLPALAVFHPHGPHCPRCGLSHPAPSWRVHGEMGTTRADTGRINHRNPNQGNVPSRTKDGQDVQAGHVPTEGHSLVVADLSQIELRGLAHLSNCPSMIQVYREGGDLHNDTCWRTGLIPWGQKPDIATRVAAKGNNFAIVNGTTEKGLYLQLVVAFGARGVGVPEWLTEEWCGKFIADWLESRPEVREYFELQWYRARRYGLVWTQFGRIKLIPEVQSTHSWIRESGLRQAQNMPITGLAADQLRLIMGKLDAVLRGMWDTGVWVWPLLTVHDSIMVEVENDYAEEVLEVMQAVMNGVMNDERTGQRHFRLPIESDGEVMPRCWRKAV